MILTHRFRLSMVLALLLACLAGSSCLSGSQPQVADGAKKRLSVHVTNVVDGDTMVVQGGDRIRFLGIDAPEKGEEYADKARERVQELVKGPVDLFLCEDKDDYGRYLGVVMIKDSNVNLTLLQEGLARPMLIPPCGNPVAMDVLLASGPALLSRKGIYSGESFEWVEHENAREKIGRQAVVRGRILNLHRGKRAWHLNFGQDYKTDFTAVLFPEGRSHFRNLGLDPADLVGREVLVLGKVKEYDGPEIIIQRPEQIIPLQ
ncbi:MAG: thermonuclease family protein [Proteobacteria bacterium]|nr:thermonuclease family protein [Pseudomonadota bacterium]